MVLTQKQNIDRLKTGGGKKAGIDIQGQLQFVAIDGKSKRKESKR